MVTDENNDVNKQISSFENFISSGCTAIMAVAFDPDGISDMAKKATESGIYVMTYDGIVDGAEDHSTWIIMYMAIRQVRWLQTGSMQTRI